MGKVVVIAMLMILTITSLSFASKEVPFTLEDRDRLIRIEEGLKATNQRIEEGLKTTNQRIDTLRLELKEDINDLKTFMLWGFGILFGGMGILIGFVIWDRRTALAPAIKKNKELEERQDKIERVIKEVALKNSDMAEALKRAGL
jgi:uncharacterized membrane-anchored protein YhcB (DUF1043 family)